MSFARFASALLVLFPAGVLLAAPKSPDSSLNSAGQSEGAKVEYQLPTDGVRWKPAEPLGLDTRVKLGLGGRLWYGATWIHATDETTIDCAFQTSRMAAMRFTHNGSEIDAGKFADKPGVVGVLEAHRSITLRKG